MRCQKDCPGQTAENGDTFQLCRQLFLPKCQIDHNQHRRGILQNGCGCGIGMGNGGKIAILHEKHAAQRKDDDADSILLIHPDGKNTAVLHLIKHQKQQPCQQTARRNEPFRRNACLIEKILPNGTRNAPKTGTQNTENRPNPYFAFDSHAITL